MTGMPSSPSPAPRDDELWSVAAFVKKLQSISEAEFRDSTGATGRGRVERDTDGEQIDRDLCATTPRSDAEVLRNRRPYGRPGNLLRRPVDRMGTALKNLDTAFKRESLPAGLDLTITGG